MEGRGGAVLVPGLTVVTGPRRRGSLLEKGVYVVEKAPKP